MNEAKINNIELVTFNDTISDIINYGETFKISDKEKEVDVDVAWKKIKNEFGDVEISLYKRKERESKSAVFFIPGLKGEVDKFKNNYLRDLIDGEGKDVILVHRNGTIIKDGAGGIDSSQRITFGKKNNQDHIGNQKEYGYKEWVNEFACAVQGVGNNYEDIKVIGHSFGGLIGLESLRLLQKQNKEVLKKIKTFLSLSGQIGKPSMDKEGQIWIDPLRNYGTFDYSGNPAKAIDWSTSFDGLLKMVENSRELKMKDPKIIVGEYLRIANRMHRQMEELPDSVDIIQVVPFMEKYFSSHQGQELMNKNNFIFVNDMRSEGKPADQHSLSLSSENLVSLLNLSTGNYANNTKSLTQNGIREGILETSL